MLAWITFVGGENYFWVSFYFMKDLYCVQKYFLLEKLPMLGCDSLVGNELNLVDCDQHKDKFKRMK